MLIGYRLAVFYNVIPGSGNKQHVKKWAEANFPEVWAEVEKLPVVTHKEDGYEMYDIKREWKA